MKLRTELPPTKSPWKLCHEEGIMLMGSCFTEHISEKLKHSGFSTFVNPNGIVYNPLSIERQLKRICMDIPYTMDELHAHEDLYFSYDHHGSFSHSDKEYALGKMEEQRKHARSFLQKASTLFITLGSSIVYTINSTGTVVANCHKQPEHLFTRKRLNTEEVIKTLSHIMDMLHIHAPQLRVVFSISPIRHLRDGLHENNLSKSTLLLAMDQIVNNHPQAYYFPSYELLLDDLRDYRFYAEDLTHPNPLAITYIWEYFSHTFFTKETQEINKDVQQFFTFKEHHPLHPDASKENSHELKTKQLQENLYKKYPQLRRETR